MTDHSKLLKDLENKLPKAVNSLMDDIGIKGSDEDPERGVEEEQRGGSDRH